MGLRNTAGSADGGAHGRGCQTPTCRVSATSSVRLAHGHSECLTVSDSRESITVPRRGYSSGRWGWVLVMHSARDALRRFIQLEVHAESCLERLATGNTDRPAPNLQPAALREGYLHYMTMSYVGALGGSQSVGASLMGVWALQPVLKSKGTYLADYPPSPPQLS